MAMGNHYLILRVILFTCLQYTEIRSYFTLLVTKT